MNLGRRRYGTRMIFDEAFFGFARAGRIDESFPYPGILKSADKTQILRGEESFEVIGQVAKLSPPITNVTGAIEPPVPAWISEDIAIIPDGAELIQRPRKLVEKLKEIRKEYGYGKLIYLQGVSDPYLIPILTYAGVSFFDDSTLRIESTGGVRYTIFGRTSDSSDSYPENVKFVETLIGTLRKAIYSGTLREIVEKYQISSKALEILRVLDNDDSGEYESVFPRRTSYIKANSLESLRRPDLLRYRKYVSEEYMKPDHKKIALLIPCSARKPYSTSKSHKLILEALSGLRSTVHEIIVTSPVGLVPRELEMTYPAKSYNIPVIGEWYEDEKVMITSMLKSYFARNSYDAVFTFVKEDLDFILDVLPDHSQRIGWVDNSASLQNLRDVILEAVNETGKTERKVNSKLETYIKIAEYQFGKWIGTHLRGSRIIRNYNTEMLVKDGKPVLIFNDRIGKFTINKNSARWFLESGKFLVEIDDFKPTANVYAVGVLGATDDIRQEDEVILHHKGSLKGVGIAKMPTGAMIDLRKGIAVKVRN